MLNMRKTAAASLFACLTLAGIAPASAEEAPLTVVTVGTYVKPVYEEIAKRFMAEHPDIPVKIESYVESWDDQLQRTILDNLTGTRPDITEQGFNRFSALVDRGFAVPIDPFIAGEADWSNEGWGPALTSLGEHQGKHWGLPFRMATPILYYNADLVRAAGGDPDRLPETWPELIALAGKISALGDGKMGMYFEYEADGAWMFLTLLHLQGGRAMQPDDRTIAFDGPEGLKALTLLGDIGRSGMVDMPREQARQGFTAGTVGFVVTAGSQIGTFERQSAGKFELRTAPLPRLSENARVPVGGGLLMVHSDDPARQKAAWEFVKYAAGPIGQTLLVRQTGMMPSNDLPAQREELLGGFYRDAPLQQANLKQVPIVTGWYTFPGPNSVKITHVIRDYMRRVITLELPPADALSAMRQDVQALLP